MKANALLMNYKATDRTMDYLRLRFVWLRDPTPPQAVSKELLAYVLTNREYFS
jgi:hypothetical protein